MKMFLAGLALALAGNVQAACEIAPQVKALHPGVGFENVRGLDVGGAPGQLPLIAFYGRRIGEADTALWIHRCLDDACSPGVTAKLDTYDFFDGAPSVVLRPDGRPLVANNHDGSANLFDCSDAACSRGSNRIVGYYVGPLDLTLALRSDGRPVLAYMDQNTRSLTLVTCVDTACLQSTVKIVATYPNFYPTMSMALTADDRPVFATSDFGGGVDPRVDLLTCDTPACHAPVVRRLADHYGYWLEVALRSDGRAVVHFAPQQGASKLVTCNDATCSMPQTQTLAGFNSTGLAMRPDNLPILEVSTGGVGFYACETETCSQQGTYQQLRSSGGGVLDASIGANGEPVAAYMAGSPIETYAAACSTGDIGSNGFEPMLDTSEAALPN